MKNPPHIKAEHWQEWVTGSGIDPEIAALNLKSLEGARPYDYLFYSDKIDRLNTGRLPGGMLNRMRHIQDGGWWASGIDVLSGDDSLWGCFKPDRPRDDGEGKIVKYEHPVKVATEIFALRCPYKLWELVARRYDTELPQNYLEAPLSVSWQWVIDHPQIPIIVTEGVKKAAAILSCGYVAIALPGIYSGIRTPKNEFGEKDGDSYLIPQLEVFAQKGRRIYVCFDQDKKRKTVRAVNNAIKKYSWLFKQHECEAKIITWHPSFGKGIDDAIVAHGREFFDKVNLEAKTFDEWEVGQLKALTYTPDLTLNQRFIGEVLPPHDAGLICLKAPKGTGKTEWMSWYTNPVLSSGERRLLLITHRIQLGLQTAKRLKIPYISETRSLPEGDYYGYGLVIDSLHPKSQARFDPNDEKWHGAWVVIDEINQVIWHLLSSKTCEKERVAIIKTLKQLFATIRETGGKVIIADADLNDVSIDFVKQMLGGNVQPWILTNDYTFDEKPWEVYTYQDKNPSRLVRAAKDKLKAGKRIMLCVSGQKAKSKWGSQVLEAYFLHKLPDLKILRIDSESVSDPNHPAFGCTEHLNEIIEKYDLVITSPTIETGVSITKEHFDCVFAISQGVQTTDSVRQHLSRYRLPVERHIWLSPTGINFVGNGATTATGLLAGTHKLSNIHIKRLAATGFTESIDGNFESICLNTWAKFGAIINEGMRNYGSQILADLKLEGHIIIEANSEEDPADDLTKNEVTATKDEIYTQHCEEIAAAESIPEQHYKALDKQQSKTKKERLEYRKGFLERRYLTQVNSELVKKDDLGWHSKIRLEYYLNKGREFLDSRDVNFASNALSAGDGDVFLPDFNAGLLGTKIAGLERLLISSLILGMGEYQEFHSEHPLVVDIFNKCKSNAWWIKLALGLGVNGIKKPIEMCQYLLKNLLGLKLPRLRREKLKDGTRRWVYGCAAANFEKDPQNPKKLLLNNLGQAIPVPDGREEVHEAWKERDVKAKEVALAQEAEAAEAAAYQQRISQENAALFQQSLLKKNIDGGVAGIREAIASLDRVYAQNILSLLNKWNQHWENLGVKFKSIIWQRLTETEQRDWKILIEDVSNSINNPTREEIGSQPLLAKNTSDKNLAGVTNSESQSEDTRTDLERIVEAVEKCQNWREYQQIALSAGQETMADVWLFVDNQQRIKIKQWEMAGLSDPIAIMQVPLVRSCA